MEYQLRDYKIKPGELDEFATEWTEKIYPLRVTHGFKVMGWIFGWNGPGSIDEAEKSYQARPDRKNRNPDPIRHIEKARTQR